MDPEFVQYLLRYISSNLTNHNERIKFLKLLEQSSEATEEYLYGIAASAAHRYLVENRTVTPIRINHTEISLLIPKCVEHFGAEILALRG